MRQGTSLCVALLAIAEILLQLGTVFGSRQLLQAGMCNGVAPRCDIQSTPAACSTKPGCFWSSTPGSGSFYTGTCSGSAKACYLFNTPQACQATGYCVYSGSGPAATPKPTPAATKSPAATQSPSPVAAKSPSPAAAKSPSPSVAKAPSPAAGKISPSLAPTPGASAPAPISMADGVQLALESGYEDLPGVTSFGTVTEYINLYANGTFSRHLCRLTAAGYHSQTNSTGTWALEENHLALQTSACTPSIRSIFCDEGEEMAVGVKVYDLYDLEDCTDGPCLQIDGMDTDKFFAGPYRLYDVSSPWKFCAA